MSVTMLNDVYMPRMVMSAGIRGKSIRNNHRTRVDSGKEYINIGWDQSLREYEVGFVPMRREAWQAIETLYEVTEGGAYGFLMEDPKDSTTTVDTGVVADLGSGEYQLYKRYEYSATRYKDRAIRHPNPTGFALYISGVLTVGGYTLDEETGVINIPAAPAAGTVTWAARFYVPVHFQNDFIDWQLVVPSQDADSRFLSGPSVVLQEVRE
jgi:uncharacterized protein (TIGR02217 family)